MDGLFEYIESNEKPYKDFWVDICSSEGISSDKDGVNETVDKIEKFCNSRGFSSKRIRFENAGDYFICDLNEESEKGIVFLAHTDTVHEKGKFGYPAVTEKDGILTGPGVVDCKGGIAVSLLVMEALYHCGYRKHLRLLLSSDEEVSERLSGDAGKQLIMDSCRGFNACFCAETSKKGMISVGRKGIYRLRVEVSGKAAHSGIAYFEGASAIKEAAYKIIEIEKLSSTGSSTFNCGVISGGSAENIVPDKCTFSVDIRAGSMSDLDSAYEKVKEIVDSSHVEGTSATAFIRSKRLPMEQTEGNMRLFEKLENVCKKYGFEDIYPDFNGGGSDAAYAVAVDVPTVCSAGVTGDGNHTSWEYAETDSLLRRSKMIAATVAEYFWA